MKEIVKVYVEDINELFNKYDRNDISDELASYIEKRCTRVLKNEMIIKIITKDKINDKIKERLVDAIRSHFGLEAKYIMLDTQKRKNVNMIFFFLGFIILLLKNFFPITKTFLDVIDILGCLIIWESVYNLLFKDSELDMKVDRSKKIIRSHIEFELISDIDE